MALGASQVEDAAARRTTLVLIQNLESTIAGEGPVCCTEIVETNWEPHLLLYIFGLFTKSGSPERLSAM
jgi:hypothetical protein